MKKQLYVLLSMLSLLGAKEKTICLNMIVKNESAAITKCLSSVKPIIDYWVIVDTGSTDGTQEIIKEFMKEIPGELYERPWVNFGHNRDEALTFAKGKGDYVLFMDADEELVFTNDFSLPKLDKDYYLIPIHQYAWSHLHVALINNHLNWKWEGVIHEGVVCPEAKTFETLEHVTNKADSKEGHRSQDPNKFLKDAAILEKELEKNPGNPRNLFYLARCYHSAGKYDLAMKYYEERTKVGGWEGERFWSFYKLGLLGEYLSMPADMFVANYTKAFECYPSRAEPLARLGYHFYNQKQYVISYALAKLGMSIPFPKNDLMCVQPSIYDYELLLILASSAYQLGNYKEAYTLYKELLTKDDLSLEAKETATCHLKILEDALHPSVSLIKERS